MSDSEIYIQVVEKEGEDPVELPVEEDGTLLLTTLQAQFPGACGLRFINPKTKISRGVRLNDGRFHAPANDEWESHQYICVFPKEAKRKSDDAADNATPSKLTRNDRCFDLVVLSLSFDTDEDALREYFEKFGKVAQVEIKKDKKTGRHKGFGFVRFESYDVQKKVLSTRHTIDGRNVQVKVPSSQEKNQLPSRVYIGRLTEDLSIDELRDHFSKFGEVLDVYIPKPFRNFGFVTFVDPDVADTLRGKDQEIKGVSIQVSTAAPKQERNDNNRNRNNRNNYRDNRDIDRDYDMGGRGGGGRSFSSPWENQDQRTGPNLPGGGMNLAPALIAAALNQLGVLANNPSRNANF